MQIDKHHQGDTDAIVFCELIDVYMGHLAALILAQSFTAVLLVFFMLSEASLSALLLWFASNMLITLISLIVAYFFKIKTYKLHYSTWHYILISITVCSGLMWGTGALLFVDVTNPYNVLFLSIILLGVLSGAVYSMSIIPVLFPVFAISTITLYIVAVYQSEELYFLITAGVVLVALWMFLSRDMYKRTHELFATRIENTKLLQSLQEEKEQVERISQAKTRFLAAASHDLRQPLQAQRLFTETILRQTDDEVLNKLGGHMLDSQRAMQSMLDALLDISRLDAGIVEANPVDVSLYALFVHLEHDFLPVSEEKGLALYIHWPPRDAMVLCDLGLLESMMRNLLSNAIRYTEQGSVMLAARKRKQGWRLEIRDSGIGIAEHHQKIIFEEFRQLNNEERDRSKGLGLGLSIVKRLCVLLDYPLFLRSKPNQGTVVAIEVPFAMDEQRQAPLSSDVQVEALKGLKILVIDDDTSVRHALTMALSSYGFEVRSAMNRMAALHEVEHWQPDILVVDYRLAEDTGADIITALRQAIKSKIPAILLTGDTAPERLQEVHDVGCPVLHKPVSGGILSKKIAELIVPIKTFNE